MPSTVEQLSPNRAKLTIEMPFSDLEPALQTAYKEIADKINLPGFRKGKVPPRLIDQRFGRGMVLQEAVNATLPEAYAKAVQENKLVPLGQPEVDITELDDGNRVVFTAEVDVRPEFDIVDAATISVQVPALSEADDLLGSQVSRLQEQFATLNELDRAAASGDVAVFDLVATQDGKPLEDAEAKAVQYKVGAGGMVDGLDEALVGMQAGETKNFTSTLVGGKLKGIEADIEIKLDKVLEQQLPDVDDEFAQMVSEFDTVEEMLDDLKENLLRINRLEQANQARELVMGQLITKTEFELPAKLIETENEARRKNIEQQLAQAGVTLEEYLAEQDEEPDTPEEFWAQIEKRAQEGLRAQIILDKYADDHQIPVDQQELTQLIFTKAQQNGTTPEQEVQHMMDHDHMAEWMNEVRRGKALGDIVAHAQVSDDSGAALDLSLLNADGTLAEPTSETDQSQTGEPQVAEKPAKKTPANKPAKTKGNAPETEPAQDEANQAKGDDAGKPAQKAPAKKTATHKSATETN